MPQNVEIKARATDLERIATIAEALAGGPPEILHQEDVFFNAAHGRLKLRIFSEASSELIFYERPDAAGPKLSRYAVAPVASPAALRELLSAALGITAVVRKRRRVSIAGRTRIHLDEVEGLGTFVELEVMMREGEPAGAGEAEARDLMRRLGIRDEDLVTVAYVDLLRDRR